MLITTLSIIIAILVIPLLILYIGGYWEDKENNRKYVLYDPHEHKEYHIFGKRIFSKKCVHPKKEYYRFDVKIFELANSYFVYIDERYNGAVIIEIDKLVDDPSEDAIRDGLVTKDGSLTRKGLVESILESDLISLKHTLSEAIVPVMWRKRFIEPVIEIKK